MRRARRRGFSLLEVLLATAILIGSSIVLMELASIGMRHAASARDRAEAQRICQTRLNEILVGLAPAEAVRPMPYEDDPRWIYWVNVHPAERAGMALLEVGVAQQVTPSKQTNKFVLQRWIRDPKAQPDPLRPGSQNLPSQNLAGSAGSGGTSGAPRTAGGAP